MRASVQTGPIGTGSYLVGHGGSRSEPQDVELWFLLLFVPLVPLSRWRVSVAQVSGDGVGESLEVTVHSKSSMAVGVAMRRIAKAVIVGILVALPLVFAVWRLGWPWAAPLLNVIGGWLVEPSILAKLGSAMELGLVFTGAVIPFLVFMHLDERLIRVPMRAAVGLSK